jgi:hypothetical protein
MTHAFRRLIRGALLLVLLLPTPGPAGAETVVTPLVSVRTEYDDNIRFSVQDPASDLVSSLQAGLDTLYRTERLQWDSSLRLRGLKYLRETDLDREEAHLETLLSRAWTERISVRGDASYRLDSALESELRETGLVTEQEDRERLTAGGGLSYQVNELEELGLSFSLGRTEYESDRFVDYDTSSLTLTWYRGFRNQRDGLTVQSYWNSQESDASQVGTYGLLCGWTRVLNETWRLNAFLGVRRTETEYSYLQQEVVFDPTLLPAFPFLIEDRLVTEEETNWGGVADVSVQWTGETWSAGASYNRDLSYSSLGEPIEQDRFGLTLEKKLDQRLTVSCSGTLSFSREETRSEDEGYRRFSLAPSLTYRLTRDHMLRAGYAYDHYEDEQVERSGRDRNRVWISLDCRWPGIW